MRHHSDGGEVSDGQSENEYLDWHVETYPSPDKYPTGEAAKGDISKLIQYRDWELRRFDYKIPEEDEATKKDILLTGLERRRLHRCLRKGLSLHVQNSRVTFVRKSLNYLVEESSEESEEDRDSGGELEVEQVGGASHNCAETGCGFDFRCTTLLPDVSPCASSVKTSLDAIQTKPQLTPQSLFIEMERYFPEITAPDGNQRSNSLDALISVIGDFVTVGHRKEPDLNTKITGFRYLSSEVDAEESAVQQCPSGHLTQLDLSAAIYKSPRTSNLSQGLPQCSPLQTRHSLDTDLFTTPLTKCLETRCFLSLSTPPRLLKLFQQSIKGSFVVELASRFDPFCPELPPALAASDVVEDAADQQQLSVDWSGTATEGAASDKRPGKKI